MDMKYPASRFVSNVWLYLVVIYSVRFVWIVKASKSDGIVKILNDLRIGLHEIVSFL